MMNILLVALGGAVGSVLRYLTGLYALRWFGHGFPWGTFAVNFVGSFAIGCMAEALLRGLGPQTELRLLIVTGVLGGFTTFSAFSLDIWALYERGDALIALLYFAATVMFSLLATGAGLFTVRALT